MIINVLQIISSADFGGGTKHVQEVHDSLCNDVNFFLAAPFNILNLKSKNFSEIQKSRVSLHDIIQLHLFVKKNSIHCIHAHGRGAAVLTRILKIMNNRVDIIYTPHGVHINFDRKIVKKIYEVYERVFGKLDHTRIFVSESEKLQYETIWLPSRKHKLVFNSIEGKTKIEKKIEFDVGVLTRLHFQKNLVEFLRIASKLPELRFAIGGLGPELEPLKRFVKQNQIMNVYFLGLVEDKKVFFNSIKVYLSTSLWEGLPYSVLESISYDVPIVLKDVVGHRDFEVGGQGACLYHSEDSAVSKILELINDPDQYRIKVDELNLLKEKYSPQQFRSGLASIYLASKH